MSRPFGMSVYGRDRHPIRHLREPREGEAKRSILKRIGETFEEAVERAEATMPWGRRIVSAGMTAQYLVCIVRVA
jgi:hypothetical protein